MSIILQEHKSKHMTCSECHVLCMLLGPCGNVSLSIDICSENASWDSHRDWLCRAVYGVQREPDGGHVPGPALTDDLALAGCCLRQGGACARWQQPHSDLSASIGGCIGGLTALTEG